MIVFNIIGIDPGKTGGIGILSLTYGNQGVSKQLGLFKMPEDDFDKRDLLNALCWYMKEPMGAYVPSHMIVMEKPAGVPKHMLQKVGLASSMKFDRHIGTMIGIMVGAEHNFRTVVPTVWQREMNCLTGGNKSITTKIAKSRFPNDKLPRIGTRGFVSHPKMIADLADTFLITMYAYRIHKQEVETHGLARVCHHGSFSRTPVYHSDRGMVTYSKTETVTG